MEEKKWVRGPKSSCILDLAIKRTWLKSYKEVSLWVGGGSERNRVHSAEGRKKKRGVGAEEMKEKVFGNHWLADLCNSDFCLFFFFLNFPLHFVLLPRFRVMAS